MIQDINTSMVFLLICGSNHMPTLGYAGQVPYGNSFHSHLQWDAVSVGEKQTRLRVSCEVREQCSLGHPAYPTDYGLRGSLSSLHTDVRSLPMLRCTDLCCLV